MFDSFPSASPLRTADANPYPVDTGSSIPYAITLVCEGDSRTAPGGGGADSVAIGEEWPALLVSKSAFAGRVHTLVNAAVGGSVMDDLIARYATSVYPYRPAATGRTAILLVAAGGNDIGSDLTASATFTKYASYCNTAIADGFIVWACTDWLRLTSWTQARNAEWLDFNKAIRGATFYTRLVDFALMMSDPNDLNFFDPDVLHFNDNGMQACAKYVNWIASQSAMPMLQSTTYVNAQTVRATIMTAGVRLSAGSASETTAVNARVPSGGVFGAVSVQPATDGAGYSGIYFETLSSGSVDQRQFAIRSNDPAGEMAFFISDGRDNYINLNMLAFTTDGNARFSRPVVLPTYTVATVPSAATFVRGLIYVSDGTSNKRLAVSDGTNWRFPDGNVVS